MAAALARQAVLIPPRAGPWEIPPEEFITDECVQVIDGRACARALKQSIEADVAGLRREGLGIGLATVVVGEGVRAITPVPGGVGPVTDVWLLRNTVTAARLLAGHPIDEARPSLPTARPALAHTLQEAS